MAHGVTRESGAMPYSCCQVDATLSSSDFLLKCCCTYLLSSSVGAALKGLAESSLFFSSTNQLRSTLQAILSPATCFSLEFTTSFGIALRTMTSLATWWACGRGTWSGESLGPAFSTYGPGKRRPFYTIRNMSAFAFRIAKKDTPLYAGSS